MEYYAHKRELPDGAIELQTVQAHLQGTAERARICLREVGLEHAAYLAGLIHDIGKMTETFQEYLLGTESHVKGSVIHTFQGCRFLMGRFHRSDQLHDIIAAELLAFAVGAHHGLFDCIDAAGRIGLKYREEKENIGYEEAVKVFCGLTSPREIDRLFQLAAEEIGGIFTKIDENYAEDDEYYFAMGLLARMLLSAVIEGDRHDTAAFMNGTVFPAWPERMSELWAERLRHVEEKIAQFPMDTPIARARKNISDQCKQFAKERPGIYRLNVPTGGGKTLSSLRYALAHGERYNKKRIIFTAPLLSILEQNAKVIRTYVGDDKMILEHYSNVVQTEKTKEELDEKELMTQNWDAPIILTTMVQLLNTLFDGRTTSIRRFQALCDSVIVIDEVQTVPTKLLTMFNLAMRYLSEQCGATIILCSATQPCLERTSHPLKEEPQDMVPYDEALWHVFERTELFPMEAARMDALPERIRGIMEEADSLLVVCNKKDEAAYLLEQTKSSEYISYHLSAAMCMQHRRDTVQAMQKALAEKKKLLCISTQVIEAGVDISFGRVLRLMAGMDSVVQCAGRCNRNGESKELCSVYLVDCTDEKLGMLEDIQRGKTATLALLEAYRNDPERFAYSLVSDASIRQYYLNYYSGMDQNAQDDPIKALQATIFDLMSINCKHADERCKGAEEYALHQAFGTAGKWFTVFDEDTIDVLTPYGTGKELISKLCDQRCQYDTGYRAELLKAAGDYSVSIYPYQKKQLEEAHGLISICEGSVLALAEEYYHEAIGITKEPKGQAFWEV